MSTATAKRVDKLYEGLSPEALGTLAIEAVLKRNDAEFNKIKSHVPMATYQQQVMGYANRVEALQKVITFIGFEFWRYAAYFLVTKSDNAFDIWKEKAINLIHFLWRVCESSQLDFDLVLKNLFISQDLAYEYKELPADEEHVSELMKILDL